MQERLQKIVAASGVASRRKAEQWIFEGKVTVNGHVVTAPGTLADRTRDHIKVNGKSIRPAPLEYYLVNKPQGVLSSASDSRGRPLVTEMVKSKCRLYPAGRLDFQSEGLVVLTNDGELTRMITRAGNLEKVYKVKVRGQPSEQALERLRKGIRSEGEQFGRCRIRPVKVDRNCWYEVGLHQGRNRQIRRMFESIGHPVMRLRRLSIGPLSLEGLPVGRSRRLDPREVASIKEQCLAAGV